MVVLLLTLPLFANSFILIDIFGWAMILGMISLSLMFLAGYGGMVSLVQMSVAGCAGYMVAIFGESVEVVAVSSWFCVGGRENGNRSSGTNDGVVGGCAVGCCFCTNA